MNLFSTNAYGFSEPTRAANADPETSHEAAAKMESSGKISKHAAIVLKIIERAPGRTYGELWQEATTVERFDLGCEMALQRRISDLIHARKIERLPKRACLVHGTKMQPVKPILFQYGENLCQ
jgi:hypothetical protein